MSFNNIIAIVGDKFDAINLISSKLVLLRDLDKIVDTNLENAAAFLNQTMPNVIIVHAKGDNKDSLDAIRDIKQAELLSNIPILLYSEDCTKEFLIDAFDCGISDIIKAPVADWELLIRVIWCIQKNEINLNNDIKNEFLTKLKIIQDKTGFYTEEYAEQFLDAEIESAIKYKNKACLMLVGPDSKFPLSKSMDMLGEIIEKSTRLNDSVGIRHDDKYYIYLPKTKLNGAYAVFERINNNLGIDANVNASVYEIKDKDFQTIKKMLEHSFEKTKNTTNTLLVAHEILEDAPAEESAKPVQHEHKDLIERRLNIKEKRNLEEQGLFKKAGNGNEGTESFAGDTLLKIEPEEKPAVNPIANTKSRADILAEELKKEGIQTRLNPVLPKVEIGELSEEEERNANLFRHAFKKKCELVTTPVFDKFKNQIEAKHYFIDINKKVDFNQSFFELQKDDKMMRLTVNYPGFSKVDIITEIFFGTEKKGYNSFSLNLTEYSFHKLSITLEGLINEYEGYIS